MALAGDPAWTTAFDQGRLVVTAGADAVWLVEDVPAEVAAFVARYWTAQPPAAADVPDDARPVVAHLQGLGALRPDAVVTPPPSVRVVPVGEAVEVPLGLPVDDGAGLAVVVRTNAPLLALADLAGALDGPHVLVDLAFDHTVVLGPFVAPGDTACLACLAGRVGTRWGDPQPPARPHAVDEGAVAAGLLLGRLLRRGPAGLSTLVNATVALDLDDLRTAREPLWPVPGCPACAEWRLSGRIAL